MEYRLNSPRKVGTKWVITSPDVPELYVTGNTPDEARSGVESAMTMLREMKARYTARNHIIKTARHTEAA